MQKLFRLCCWSIPIVQRSCLALWLISLLSWQVWLPVTAAEISGNRFISLANEFPNAPVTSYAIAQDQQGFIWLGNQLDGLQRFDGYQLQQFELKVPSVANIDLSVSTVLAGSHDRLYAGTWGHGLVMLTQDRLQQRHWNFSAAGKDTGANQIQALFEDQQQRLWAGTVHGLFGLDRQLQPIALPTVLQQALRQQRIWQIAQSADGELWLATSRGLYQVSSDLQQSKLWPVPALAAQPNSARFAEVRTLLPVAQGIWFANSDGLFLLDRRTQQIKALPVQQQQLTRSNRLLLGRDGQLLIASSDGLYQLIAPFSYRQQLQKLLHAVDVRDLLQDTSGLIWLASRNRGVFQLSTRPQKFPPLLDSHGQRWFSAGLHRIASQLYHQGDLWLGLEQSVLHFDPEQKRWKQFDFAAEDLVSLVSGLAVTAGNLTWAATNNGLFRLDKKTGLVKQQLPLMPDISLMSLSYSADGYLNLGLWQQGLLRWRPDQPDKPALQYKIANGNADGIQQSASDSDGALWLASSASGLYRFDPQDESVVHYSTAADAPVVLPSNNISCVTPVSADEIWLCSDQGLLRLDPVRQTLESFSTAAGLPDNRVIAIDAQHPDNLWISTRRGLAQLVKSSKKIRSFGEQDGIPSLLLEPRALHADANGHYYLGTATGVLTFHPAQLTAEVPQAKLAISAIQLDQQRLWQHHPDENQPLLLSAQHKMLHVQFSLLDFEHSKHHQYRYRLRGLTDEWQHQSYQNSASFSHLPPGRYQLEVEVVSASNPPPPLRMYLQVARPWWMFKLVWFFAGLSLVVLLALVIRFRVYRLQKTASKLNLLVAQRTQDLALANLQLAQQARTDFLTKLPNRLAFTEQYELIQRQRSRDAAPLCLAMIDLDFFKKINDEFGHEAGDLVLQGVAEQLQQRLRQQDILARFGGEEFVLLLPDTADTGAIIICETLRLTLHQLNIQYQQQRVPVTATFGVVELDLQNQDLNYWQNAADEALYYGKAQGRDQVVLYSDLPQQHQPARQDCVNPG